MVAGPVESLQPIRVRPRTSARRLMQGMTSGPGRWSPASRLRTLGILWSVGVPASLASQPPTVHRLPATPETVAYGYYWANAKPALRIRSGDVIVVETLLTSTPDRLERAGIRPELVQQSLRDVVSRVTDRGPGGHIL